MSIVRLSTPGGSFATRTRGSIMYIRGSRVMSSRLPLPTNPRSAHQQRARAATIAATRTWKYRFTESQRNATRALAPPGLAGYPWWVLIASAIKWCDHSDPDDTPEDERKDCVPIVNCQATPDPLNIRITLPAQIPTGIDRLSIYATPFPPPGRNPRLQQLRQFACIPAVPNTYALTDDYAARFPPPPPNANAPLILGRGLALPTGPDAHRCPCQEEPPPPPEGCTLTFPDTFLACLQTSTGTFSVNIPSAPPDQLWQLRVTTTGPLFIDPPPPTQIENGETVQITAGNESLEETTGTVECEVLDDEENTVCADAYTFDLEIC